MKVLGIVAEYNPFHNGHLYHLEKSKELSKADFTIVVLSGDFTQRGMPALLDRRTRAKMALKSGADLVCSLPIYTSVSSASGYASGAIHLLKSLNIISDLAFGIEDSDLNQLKILAENEDLLRLLGKRQIEPNFINENQILFKYLKEGFSFPKALSLSIKNDLKFPNQPNAILGLYYLMALKETNFNINTITIPRISNQYHDLTLNTSGISSATAIRESIKNNSLEEIKNQVPLSTYKILLEEPLYNEDNFNLMYQYLIETKTPEEWSYIEDSNIDIGNRIYNHRFYYKDYHQFVGLIKNKSITYNRITRILTHGLLNLTKTEYNLHNQSLGKQLIHILGFRKEASSLVKYIKEKSNAPVILNTKDYKSNLSPELETLFQKDILASQIYHLSKPYNELQQNPIII